jgi:hypothetical protein
VLTRPCSRPRFEVVASTSPLTSEKVRPRIVPGSSIKRKSTWALNCPSRVKIVASRSSRHREKQHLNTANLPHVAASATSLLLRLETSPLAYRSTCGTAGTRSLCYVFQFHRRRTCLSLLRACTFLCPPSHLSSLLSDIGKSLAHASLTDASRLYRLPHIQQKTQRTQE